MFENELPMYPYYWIIKLTEKRNKFGRTEFEQELHDWMENNPR